MSVITSKETKTMSTRTNVQRRHPKHLMALALLLALAVLGAFASIASAASAPSWSLDASAYPSHLAPGETFESSRGPYLTFLAANLGGAPTSGTITITDTLPIGVSPGAGSAAESSRVGNGAFPGVELACSAIGQTMSCSGEPMINPGESIKLVIPVNVSPGASGVLANEATIEGGEASPVNIGFPLVVDSELPSFDFEPGPSGLHGITTNPDGTLATQAGSHPAQTEVAMNFTRFTDRTAFAGYVSGGGEKDIHATLPRGTVINPNATPVKCAEFELETSGGLCPAASQVGTIRISWSPSISPAAFIRPLYNMRAPGGTPATLGFEVLEGLYVHLTGRVRSNGQFELASETNDIPAKVPLYSIEVSLWGNPSATEHDHVRGECIAEAEKVATCPDPEPSSTAFLTMPSDCSGPTTTKLSADSWEEIGDFKERTFLSQDAGGNPIGTDGCNKLEFEPTIESKSTTNLADSPSGLDFTLHQPQNLDVQNLSTANLKDTTVTLPAGMTLNPSSGAGLDGCTEAQLDKQSLEPANCPNASKLGTVEVMTPLVAHPLPGSVYLAKPFANPFGSLLAIYITVADPRTGVVAKLPGKVTADPSTGQLTTTVSESPELPLEDVTLHLSGGARAPLTTPAACGTQTTTSDLTPWSAPEGAHAHPTGSFLTSVQPGGGPCPANEAQQGNSPSFSAGTIAPRAGAYSPFVLKLNREDGSQRLAGLDATLPEGLTGKLVGVPYCSEAQIAAAKAREAPNRGVVEENNPSCPAASEVGGVDVAAGSGPTPFFVHGHAYLAGPYKGAPLSLVTIAPAVAGPFDLGAVVVRTALYVDPETAQIHAVSDPFPRIIEGIPLDLRSVILKLDRPQFSLNPTSCDPMSVKGSMLSSVGQNVQLSSPFQVGGCSSLPFKPQLSIRLKGSTKRTGHPTLIAIATAKPGEANIGEVSATLPRSEFLDQGHIGTVCTRVQFAEGQTPGEKCPAKSIYGHATATTPLLAEPLSGPVFLRSSNHELPDLVVALHGQVDVVVHGRVDAVHGALRNTFEAVPDAPVSKFVLTMQGGKKGLVVNSTNLCKQTNRATILMDGQNGKVHDFKPVVRTSCKGKGRKQHKRHH